MPTYRYNKGRGVLFADDINQENIKLCHNVCVCVCVIKTDLELNATEGPNIGEVKSGTGAHTCKTNTWEAEVGLP